MRTARPLKFSIGSVELARKVSTPVAQIGRDLGTPSRGCAGRWRGPSTTADREGPGAGVEEMTELELLGIAPSAAP